VTAVRTPDAGTARHPALVVVKGGGDVASAVAHRLKRVGWRPVLVVPVHPVVTRRAMSLGGAAYTGQVELEGFVGVRCRHAADALAVAGDERRIPVLLTDDPAAAVTALGPAAMVDARLRKRIDPEVQLAEAPFTVGIGPGFCAGEHVHAVVESNWGENLGRVLYEGGSQAYTGRHRVVAGHGAERYVYAPHAGTFRTDRDVGQAVPAREVVAFLDGTPLTAPIAGVLRGLAYDGTPVTRGAKLLEVDPNGDPAACRGIAERPARIAEGVLEALGIPPFPR